MAADVVLFDLGQVAYAGALHDPVAALVFCTPSQVAFSIINGRIVVRNGLLASIELPPILEIHNKLAFTLAELAH